MAQELRTLVILLVAMSLILSNYMGLQLSVTLVPWDPKPSSVMQIYMQTNSHIQKIHKQTF